MAAAAFLLDMQTAVTKFQADTDRIEHAEPAARTAFPRGGLEPPVRASSTDRRSSRHSTFPRSYRLSDDEAMSWVSIAMPQCNRYIALRSPLQHDEACSVHNRGLGASLARGERADAPRHAFTNGPASCGNLAADRMRPSEVPRTRSLPQGIAGEVVSTRDPRVRRATRLRLEALQQDSTGAPSCIVCGSRLAVRRAASRPTPAIRTAPPRDVPTSSAAPEGGTANLHRTEPREQT
jgi:hypothetical protein